MRPGHHCPGKRYSRNPGSGVDLRTGLRAPRTFARKPSHPEHNRHPLFRAGELEHPGLALVAVLAQQEALCADLNPVGVVGAGRYVRALAALVIDRCHLCALALDEIDMRGEVRAARTWREAPDFGSLPPPALTGRY